MIPLLRREVLQAFKNIHKARKDVFSGDDAALRAARIKINEEFRKNKNVEDQTAIHDMIVFANAITQELRTTVVQGKEITPGIYKLRISAETKKLDNVPFDPDVEIPKNSKKSSPPCKSFDVIESFIKN